MKAGRPPCARTCTMLKHRTRTVPGSGRARPLPAPARPRLRLEALEDRLALSWAGVPPATITPPGNAVPVTLDNQGDASGGAVIENNEDDYYTFVAHGTGTYQ